MKSPVGSWFATMTLIFESFEQISLTPIVPHKYTRGEYILSAGKTRHMKMLVTKGKLIPTVIV